MRMNSAVADQIENLKFEIKRPSGMESLREEAEKEDQLNHEML